MMVYCEHCSVVLGPIKQQINKRASVVGWAFMYVVIWFQDPGLRSRYSNIATGCTIQGSNPGRGKTFFLFTTFRPVLGPIQPPFQWVQGLLYRRWSDRVVKLVPGLGMKGAIPPVPLCALMEFTGSPVRFHLYISRQFRPVKQDRVFTSIYSSSAFVIIRIHYLTFDNLTSGTVSLNGKRRIEEWIWLEVYSLVRGNRLRAPCWFDCIQPHKCGTQDDNHCENL